MLAVSSSWIEDPTDPEAAVERVRAIGVQAVELEYRLAAREAGPLVRAFHAAGIAVQSVHNFCPYPSASGRAPSGDLYDLASLDPAEVPDEEETAWLIDAMRARGVTGYWHDVGHAHVRQVYGVGDELAWLERFCDSLVGLHLHDARGFHDHLIPGEGEIDFEAIAARVPRDREVLFTLELGPAWPVERVRTGVLRLLAAGLH